MIFLMVPTVLVNYMVKILFISIFLKNRFFMVSKFWAMELKISPRGYFRTPRRSKMTPGPPEPLHNENPDVSRILYKNINMLPYMHSMYVFLKKRACKEYMCIIDFFKWFFGPYNKFGYNFKWKYVYAKLSTDLLLNWKLFNWYHIHIHFLFFTACSLDNQLFLEVEFKTNQVQSRKYSIRCSIIIR